MQARARLPSIGTPTEKPLDLLPLQPNGHPIEVPVVWTRDPMTARVRTATAIDIA